MQSATGGTLPLDTTVIVTTPENVSFDFRLAGPFPRFAAFLVDLLLLMLAMGLLGTLLSLLGATGVGFFLSFLFVAWWGAGAMMEAFYNGQTLGKKAVGIRVVSDSGLSINPSQAILRNVLRAADLLPPLFPGVASMLFTRRFQRLGDLAAQTMVVFDGGNAMPQTEHSFRGTEEFFSRIPTRFRADPALIEALAAYVGRRNSLSKPRRRELAHHLAKHFIRIWNLPSKTDPDFVLCAIYEFATMKISDESESLQAVEPIFDFEDNIDDKLNAPRGTALQEVLRRQGKL